MDKNLILTLDYKKPRLFLKVILGIMGVIFLGMIALFVYLGIKSNQFIQNFANAAGISKEETLDTVSASLNQFQTDYKNIDQLTKKYNFLVLGSDGLSGREGDPELTDSIMLLQTDFISGKVKTLSLPRDLYINDYQTKINALYFYGKDKYPDNPEQFPREVIEALGNIKIDYTIVIGIEDLERVIDLIGGIEVNVPIAFTDPLFPVQGVDVSKITDPKILYEEVNFKEGQQHMNGLTALKYMRSRHSGDDQGTDDARAERQQLIIQSLFDKLLTIKDPQIFGQLYRFYLDKYAKNISISDLTRIAVVFIDYLSQNESNHISFEKHQLKIYPDDKDGVIFNPPLWQSKQQWIYQIRDLNKFTESINVIFN